MEDSLRQLYRQTRLCTSVETPVLTPRELNAKEIVARCVHELSKVSEEELKRLVQVLRAEGLQISEPSIREEKFVTAAVIVSFESLSKMFAKL